MIFLPIFSCFVCSWWSKAGLAVPSVLEVLAGARRINGRGNDGRRSVGREHTYTTLHDIACFWCPDLTPIREWAQEGLYPINRIA